MTQTATVWIAGVCVVLGCLTGRKYPVVAGALFSVAIIAVVAEFAW